MADDNNRGEYFEERAGTDEARYHAVPYENKGWAVKKEGQDDPESTYSSKDEAADEVKRLAKEAGTIAYIHDEDGQIESQENYKE